MVYYQIIIPNERVFDVSDEILAKCVYFKIMLQNNMQEVQSRDIILKDISSIEIGLLLRYLHHKEQIFEFLGYSQIKTLLRLFDRFPIENGYEDFINCIQYLKGMNDPGHIYYCIKILPESYHEKGIKELLCRLFSIFN